MTPLHYCSFRGCIEVLLRAGADVHAKDSRGYTALHTLAEENCEDLAESVRLLVNSGSDVNGVSLEGDTPIKTAARSGNVVVISELLRQGADVNLTNKLGVSPLISAVGLNQCDALQFLLEYPAVDLNIQDISGWRILRFAAAFGDHRTLQILQNHSALLVDAYRAEGSQAKIVATYRNFPDPENYIASHDLSAHEEILWQAGFLSFMQSIASITDAEAASASSPYQ